MKDINLIIEEKVEQLLKDCDTLGLVYTCQKLSTPQGKKFVVTRLIQIMEANQSYTFQNALADLEVQLTDLELY